LTLELASPTLPPGKKIVFDLKDTAKLAETKKNPVVIKEGVEYKFVSSQQVLVVFLMIPQRPNHLQSKPFHHLRTSV